MLPPLPALGDARIVFMGTPVFARASLDALLAAGEHVVAVVTQPDRPKGRSKTPAPPPVKERALEAGIPVLQPRRIRKGPFQSELAALEPDLLVVAAYGRILPGALLDMPSCGAVNVHASLLPRHRGAGPIQAAILAGDAETGITIMQMDEGLDTGPRLHEVALPIAPDDTASSLHDRLAALGGTALCDALALWRAGTLRATPQDDARATYAPMLSKGDGAVDWSAPAERLDALVRAMFPWPGATSHFRGRGLKLFPLAGHRAEETSSAPGTVLAIDAAGVHVACGDGAVVLGDVQLAGKRRMPSHAFARGARLELGERFGEAPP